MYKVLIVEDEILVRMGLKNSINWAKYDMMVIADAPDGKKALEFYERFKPDIVITDLKMPIMDGMDLILNIRKKDANTRILILTCIEEFGAVHNAMKLGVSGYILKLTMTTQEMEDVLEKLNEELVSMGVSKRGTSGVNENVIKETIFKDYLFNNLFKEDQFGQKLKGLKCRLNPENLIMSLLEIRNYDKLTNKFMDGRDQLMRTSIMNVFHEVLTSYGRGEVFQDTEKRYAFIFSFSDMVSEITINEKLYEIMDRIRKMMSTYFDIQVSFGVSSMNSGYKNLSSMYEECKKACELMYYKENELSLRWSEKTENFFLDSAVKKLKGIADQLYSKNLIDETLMTPMNDMLKDLLDKSKHLSRENTARIIIQLMEWLIEEMNFKRTEKINTLIGAFGFINSAQTIDEALNIFTDIIMEINKKMGRQKYLSKGVNDCLQYIQQNYSSGISIKDLSERLGFTPNYLSNLFRKEMGIYLLDYINKLRVEKAKELLNNTNMKSYEIAEKVGFKDDSYFSRVFKKFTGLRPNEFRRVKLHDDSEGNIQ